MLEEKIKKTTEPLPENDENTTSEEEKKKPFSYEDDEFGPYGRQYSY